jgi:uncharacterized protein
LLKEGEIQMTPTIIMYGLIIIFLSSMIQGITGFGFALFAVPLLTIFILPGESKPLFTVEQAIPMLICYGLLSALLIIFKSHNHIKLREIWVMILFGIIGIPMGYFILEAVDPDLLKLIAGIIIIITAVILMKGYVIKLKSYSLASMIAGFFSGLLNGSLSMSGPPIVLFLSNQNVEKEYFRANITFYGIITNIIAIAIFAFKRKINLHVLAYAGILAPALIIGVLAGIIISLKVNEKLFKKLTLLLLIATGVMSVVFTVGKIARV